MQQRPFTVRLLEIAVPAAVAIAITIDILDGIGGIQILSTLIFGLISVALALFITRRKSGIAWIIETVFAAIWVPYFAWYLLDGFGELGLIGLIKGVGWLGFVNISANFLVLILLFSAGVRRWVDSRPIEPPSPSR